MRCSRVFSGALAIAVVIAAPPAAAQRRTAAELQPGDQVRIKVRGVRLPVQGAVSFNSPDTILVLRDPRSAPTMVLWNTATRVQQSLGTSHVQGLATGMRRGAIVSGLVALVVSPFFIPACLDAEGSTPCTQVVPLTYGAMLGIGSAVGSVLGFAIGADRWRDIPLQQPARTSSVPLVVPGRPIDR